MGILNYNSEKEFLELILDKKDVPNEQLFSTLRSSSWMYSLETKFNTKKRVFRFSLEGRVSLKSRWSNTIDKNEFSILLDNMFNSMVKLFSGGIAPEFMDWTPDLIFLDDNAKIYFLVYPLEVKTVEGGSIFKLVRMLIKNARPTNSEDEVFFNNLKSHLDDVQKGQLSEEQYLIAVKQLVHTEVLNNVPYNYDLSRLKAMFHGVEIPTTQEEPEDEVKQEVNLGGVSLNMANVNVDVKEKTEILDDEEDFDDGKTQMLDEEDYEETPVVGYLIRSDKSNFELNTGNEDAVWKFGRYSKKGNPRVDIEIPNNPNISGVHFRVLYKNGQWGIEDLGSTNGTHLNGDKLTKGSIRTLHDGDTVKVANETMIFSCEVV